MEFVAKGNKMFENILLGLFWFVFYPVALIAFMMGMHVGIFNVIFKLFPNIQKH